MLRADESVRATWRASNTEADARDSREAERVRLERWVLDRVVARADALPAYRRPRGAVEVLDRRRRCEPAAIRVALPLSENELIDRRRREEDTDPIVSNAEPRPVKRGPRLGARRVGRNAREAVDGERRCERRDRDAVRGKVRHVS